MSYDNWKTESPHEGATCPNCGEFLEELYTNWAPPSLVCPECEEAEDVAINPPDPRRSFWGLPS